MAVPGGSDPNCTAAPIPPAGASVRGCARAARGVLPHGGPVAHPIKKRWRVRLCTQPHGCWRKARRSRRKGVGWTGAPRRLPDLRHHPASGRGATPGQPPCDGHTCFIQGRFPAPLASRLWVPASPWGTGVQGPHSGEPKGGGKDAAGNPGAGAGAGQERRSSNDEAICASRQDPPRGCQESGRGEIACSKQGREQHGFL